MTLLTTSFHMHPSAEQAFLLWLRTAYAPALEASGAASGAPTLARIIDNPHPDTASFAFQTPFADLAAARAWHDSAKAQTLRDNLHASFGDSLVHFTTYMETLDL